jgi:hypothetical protein
MKYTIAKEDDGYVLKINNSSMVNEYYFHTEEEARNYINKYRKRISKEKNNRKQ